MDDDNRLKGLGGWLVLVGIGVVFAPVRVVAEVWTTYYPVFRDGYWHELTNPEMPNYLPYWGSIVIFELLYNAVQFLFLILMIYLFFRKHYLFPRLYIFLLVVTIAFLLVDAWLASLIIPGEPVFDPDTVQNLGQGLVAVVIWAPYMLVSKRVKATFVEGRRSADESVAERFS